MTGELITIAAGTVNPAKMEAIRRAAAEFVGDVQIRSISVDPGVPVQPWGDDQTAHGALIRARTALDAVQADYGIGVESGLADGPGGRLYVVSWAAAIDTHGRTGFGGSERFPVPGEISRRLREGHELGPLLGDVFDQRGLENREGAVSIFTGGRRTRTELLHVAVLHAFAALLEPWADTGSSTARPLCRKEQE